MQRSLIKKFGLPFIISIIALTAISVAIADTKEELCNYTLKGDYISPNGQISAYGTMDHAAQCAGKGLLPEIVQNRLGQWGSKDRANAILQINLDAQTKKIDE